MSQDAPMYTILGIDPGLAATGFAVARVQGRSDVIESVLAVGLIESKVDYDLGNKSNGQVSRAGWLNTILANFVSEYEVDAIACEMPFISPQAFANFAHGLTMGAIAALNIPMMLVRPHQVKAAALRRSATKRDVIAWALSVTEKDSLPWPTSKTPNRLGLTFEGKQVASYAEHLADALAAIQAGIRTREWLCAPDRA